jgi:hypothetical protein
MQPAPERGVEANKEEEAKIGQNKMKNLHGNAVY